MDGIELWLWLVHSWNGSGIMNCMPGVGFWALDDVKWIDRKKMTLLERIKTLEDFTPYSLERHDSGLLIVHGLFPLRTRMFGRCPFTC